MPIPEGGPVNQEAIEKFDYLRYEIELTNKTTETLVFQDKYILDPRLGPYERGRGEFGSHTKFITLEPGQSLGTDSYHFIPKFSKLNEQQKSEILEAKNTLYTIIQFENGKREYILLTFDEQ
jgi:hypothetical protein